MSTKNIQSSMLIMLALLAGAAIGYFYADYFPEDDKIKAEKPGAMSVTERERKVLYWYDPMFPQQQFDQPGKSPFMDMELVPKYADEENSTASVSIDPGQAQNIAVRYATVTRGSYATTIDAIGTFAYNERDVAIVQSRAVGFVEQVYPLAPGDVIESGAPLADILVPEWTAAQIEFLALLKTGETTLIEATRERLKLLGMSSWLIKQIEETGKTRPIISVTAPIAGVIRELEIRTGMAVTTGQTFARINGIESVWLDVAVPMTQGATIKTGDSAEARVVAYPGQVFSGKVIAILPELNVDTRTLRVRLEFENEDSRFRPGMYAEVTLRNAEEQMALQVVSEAVIRTGRHALVMRVDGDGRYQPVEVETGPEVEGMTVILSGLEEGQQVVASGQFLFDSEANLRGIVPTVPEKTHVHGGGE